MICQTCKKEFEDKTGKRKYCSTECFHESHRCNRFCVTCGKRLNYQQKKCCSYECYYKYRKGKFYPSLNNCPEKLIPLTPEQIKITTEARRKKLIDRSIKWQKENPEKTKASSYARSHKNELLILYECACDHPEKHRHHFDYELKNIVILLCPNCHAAEHARLRRLLKPKEEVIFSQAI